MTRRTARTIARPLVVALALTLLGSALGGALTATSASAADDPTDNGLWYYTRTGLAAVHQHTTGKGITVAVLDSPINPAAPDLVGAKNLITRHDSFCEDVDGAVAPAVSTDRVALHATGMVSLIIGTGTGTGGQPGTLGVAPGATVRHYAVMLEGGVGNQCSPEHPSGIGPGIDQAVADGAKIISISISGGDVPEDNKAIGRAERAGVIVVVASLQRGGTDLGWPTSANGVVAVESGDANGNLSPVAVTSPLLTVVAPGMGIRQISWADGRWDTYAFENGSSNATAWTSGVLALAWSAHPKASANQIIQTLVRNTGSGKGQLVRNDNSGYGGASVKGVLGADPTTYPDVNPLLRKGADAKPAYADIVAPPKLATAQPSAGGVSPGLLIAGAGLLALVVLAAIVLAVVLSRRKRTAPAPEPASQSRPIQ